MKKIKIYSENMKICEMKWNEMKLKIVKTKNNSDDYDDYGD